MTGIRLGKDKKSIALPACGAVGRNLSRHDARADDAGFDEWFWNTVIVGLTRVGLIPRIPPHSPRGRSTLRWVDGTTETGIALQQEEDRNRATGHRRRPTHDRNRRRIPRMAGPPPDASSRRPEREARGCPTPRSHAVPGSNHQGGMEQQSAALQTVIERAGSRV